MKHECKYLFYLYDWQNTLNGEVFLLPSLDGNSVKHCFVCGKSLDNITVELNELIKLKTER